MTATHERYIHRAYALARQALVYGNHPFGALLVHEDHIILVARNTVITSHDPTQHAELRLVSKAARRFSADILAQSTLYTSTEPCAMCAGAIYWAGIPTVVFGCSAAALAQLAGDDFLIPSSAVFAHGQRAVTLIGPVLEDEGIAVHGDFWA